MVVRGWSVPFHLSVRSLNQHRGGSTTRTFEGRAHPRSSPPLPTWRTATATTSLWYLVHQRHPLQSVTPPLFPTRRPTLSVGMEDRCALAFPPRVHARGPLAPVAQPTLHQEKGFPARNVARLSLDRTIGSDTTKPNILPLQSSTAAVIVRRSLAGPCYSCLPYRKAQLTLLLRADSLKRHIDNGCDEAPQHQRQK